MYIYIVWCLNIEVLFGISILDPAAQITIKATREIPPPAVDLALTLLSGAQGPVPRARDPIGS